MRKLSEVKGLETFEVMAALVDPICSMASSKQLKKLMERKEVPEGETAEEFTLDRIRKSLPDILTHHSEDIVAVLAAIDGKTSDDYESSMTPMSLWVDVMELIGDEQFLAFLASLGVIVDSSPSS